MKHLCYFLIFVILIACSNESERKITTEIGFIPKQDTSISDENFRKWTHLLKNTYASIEAKGGTIVYGDHLNIATAFIKLKEPKQKVLDQFYLAQQKNLESTAEIFPLVYQSHESVAGYLSKAEYEAMLEQFAQVMANKEEVKIDPVGYAQKHQLDVGLVQIMADLKEQDQLYRTTDITKQLPIDQQNILVIDSLYGLYGKYIGSALVGKEYQHSMWAVIQHSDLEHQEFYLPVVHAGVVDGVLPATPLKMLIDRVYKKKYGHQIFGSQTGGVLADDATINKVKEKYGL